MKKLLPISSPLLALCLVATADPANGIPAQGSPKPTVSNPSAAKQVGQTIQQNKNAQPYAAVEE